MSFVRVDLLLLDEFSYAKFGQEESELLFKIIADHSEKVSTMITTNLCFSQWTKMLANVTLTVALIDRLTFHSHILNINGFPVPNKMTVVFAMGIFQYWFSFLPSLR